MSLRETEGAREAAALREALRRASRDAPRRDLWPQLEAEMAALARPRRARGWAWPARRLALAVLSLTLVLAIVAGALAYARPRGPVVATGTAPELLLGLTYQSASQLGGYGVDAYRSGEVTSKPLLDHAAGVPTVAPDGRQLFFVEQTQEGQTARTALVAYASDTLARQWSAPLGEQAVSELGEHRHLSRVVVADDRVYVASFRLGLADPLAVRVLGRGDGAVVAEWPVTTEGRIVNEVNLLAAPDGKRLHLFVRLADAAASVAGVRDWQVTVALPDGGQQVRLLADDLVAATTLYGAGGRIAPDGRTFYRLTFEGRVAFFDLERDTRPTLLALPFARTAAGGLIPLAQGVAPDGGRLYALAPTLGQLAIVDLAGRRVERVVQLGGSPGARDGGPVAGAWGALRDWLVPGAGATGNFTATIQVSPDGKRLYAVGATGHDATARLGGIWVIETEGWRIAEQWQAGETIEALLLVDGGRGLIVQAGGRVRLLDTTSGQFHSELPGSAALMTSLSELYREQYGRALRGVR